MHLQKAARSFGAGRLERFGNEADLLGENASVKAAALGRCEQVLVVAVLFSDFAPR
jgi:hypothetical protein